MKKIGFIGAYDKTDLIIYVAKILQSLGKEILVIDATENQKARYIIPKMTPTLKYVTDFEGIDIAVGFSKIEEIKEYLGLAVEQDLAYDIMIIDKDNPKNFNTYQMETAELNYFVTCFDAYSLKKGLEVFGNLEETINLKKVLFSREMLKEEDDYLNYLSSAYKIKWDENRLYFPIENGDLSYIYENHRVEKIRLKYISVQFKDGLDNIASEILGNKKGGEARRIIKMLEKGE